MIRFNKIWKSYSPGKYLFCDLSLNLPSRCVTALIGHSGSGKSTLLKLINGLLRPEKGDVFIDDRPLDYANLIEVRGRMGYMVQGGGLFPHLTIGANISLKAKLSGWSKPQIAERLDQLLQMVSLPAEYRHRYPYQLSGGEQQRVALCRALMLSPDILLLDEPFGALDPATRQDIQNQFLHIKDALGFTAVLVTHDMQEALQLADFMVLLERGKVKESADRSHFLSTAAELSDNFATPAPSLKNSSLRRDKEQENTVS